MFMIVQFKMKYFQCCIITHKSKNFFLGKRKRKYDPMIYAFTKYSRQNNLRIKYLSSQTDSGTERPRFLVLGVGPL